MNPPRYIVITPARNEEEHLGQTIRSMAGQSNQPLLWIVVDDGSTDRTGELIDAAAREHSWIRPVHRADRGFRKSGGGVVEAFYAGYERAQGQPWEFLVKLDADLSFEPDYFARCLQKFAEEPRLGMGGGLICHRVNGALVAESPHDAAFHVRGATKIYRRECWQALGRLWPAAGWDTIDELKANMLGWTTRTFPDIALFHHRFTGTVDGQWKNNVKFGLGSYIIGYHPVFMAAKCLRHTVRRPYLKAALGLWLGFCSGYIKRVPRVDDRDLIRYTRRQQINKLVGKPSLW